MIYAHTSSPLSWRQPGIRWPQTRDFKKTAVLYIKVSYQYTWSVCDAMKFISLISSSTGSQPAEFFWICIPVCSRKIWDVTSLVETAKLKNWSGNGNSYHMTSVTRLRAGKSGVQIPPRARDFSLLQNVQTASESHPASCSTDTGSTFSGGVQWPGREADHSPPSSFEVHEWSYTSTPSCLQHHFKPPKLFESMNLSLDIVSAVHITVENRFISAIRQHMD